MNHQQYSRLILSASLLQMPLSMKQRMQFSRERVLLRMMSSRWLTSSRVLVAGGLAEDRSVRTRQHAVRATTARGDMMRSILQLSRDRGRELYPGDILGRRPGTNPWSPCGYVRTASLSSQCGSVELFLGTSGINTELYFKFRIQKTR